MGVSFVLAAQPFVSFLNSQHFPLIARMDDMVFSPEELDSAKGNRQVRSKHERRKVRAACNPCHSQKLRCVIQRGAVSCERCIKLHKSCKFAPRAPRSSLQPGRDGAQGRERKALPANATNSTPSSNSMMFEDTFDESPFSPNFSIDMGEGQGKLPVNQVNSNVLGELVALTYS